MQITLPQIGESIVEGYINRWLVEPGQLVSKYDPLVEIVTDKVSMEFPAPISGTISKILVSEGETVSTGTPILDIEVSHAKSIQESPKTVDQQSISRIGKFLTNVAPVGPTGSGKPVDHNQKPSTYYSPAVLRIAKTNNIDLSNICGSGENGRITLKDLKGYISSGNSKKSDSDQNFSSSFEIVSTSPIRKIISKRMETSAREIPHAWTMVEVDVSELVNLRNTKMDAFWGKEGIKLTFLPFVINAVCIALRENPLLNSSWHDGEIWINKEINIGIAVSSENGLFVPIIENADKLTISQIARNSDSLINRARDGLLNMEDVQNGSFTINNTGALGSIISHPLINHPQAAILTSEKITKRPVVIDDSIKIRHIMNTCLSFDHRIMDGMEASNFLDSVKQNLEKIFIGTKLN